MGADKTPLLLIDSETMYVIGAGTYKVESISFEEARGIIEVFDDSDILKCYTDRAIDQVVHDYVGVEKRNFTYQKIRSMRPGQMAIVFKTHTTPSETQPIVEPAPGVQAKKIQNVYVFCESITRLS